MGYILTKMLHIGAAIIGAIAGVFLALALYNLIFFFVDNRILLISFSVVLAILMAFLSFRYYDKIVIFSTSFIGSYSFVRGISLLAGYFPNEVDIVQNIATASPNNLPWQFYLYLVGFVGMFIGGSIYQNKQKEKEEEMNFRKAE